METVFTIFIFLIVLSVLVLIHEFGHFLAAKKFGIKVEEFGFGFPPKLLGVKKDETEYTINALPIGGFVKLYGEDEAGGGSINFSDKHLHVKKQNLDRAFFFRPAWQRATVILAGICMNAVLAIVIFYLFLFIAGFKTDLPLLFDHRFFLVDQKNETSIILDGVSKGSPADKAGVKPFSKVISVEGRQMNGPDEFVRVVNENRGKQITMNLQNLNTDGTYSVKVTPRLSPPKNQGALGVRFGGIESATLVYDTPLMKAFSGFIHPANLVVYNFDVLEKLIALSIREKTTAPVGTAVAGPVGIYKVFQGVTQIPIFKEEVLQGLNLVGLISISLAIFNVLPIPALDGGRLFFIVLEMAVGKKISPKYEALAHTIGFALLMFILVLVTFKDVKTFF